MKKITKIGVLTSGGDCAGLNAAIRAITFRAINGFGWDVFGIKYGTQGLMERPVDTNKLDLSLFTGDFLRRGGTILGSINRGDPFAFPMPDGTVLDRSDEIISGYHNLGLDAVIAIGGDGSLAILRRLAQQGDMNLIGIPKTIDNDVGRTENSIGYATAVDVATEALDRLQPTAASHDRVMVLEVMGRDAGHIALSAGIAGGADAILLPEIKWDLSSLIQKLNDVRVATRNFALVIVAEAARLPTGEVVGRDRSNGEYRLGGVAHEIGRLIEEVTNIETRVTVLGHVQRGGVPNASDRLYASAFGVKAVDLIAEKKFDRLVVWSDRECSDVSLEDGIRDYRTVDLNGTLVKTARGLGIYIGDR
ncbi:MAG: ATP-dependent 6-phosphofructokinase [Pseudomonadota bacterium]|nr:ATP-dependent 6-phosphofructokinase [Pseudomonadota bacterium]